MWNHQNRRWKIQTDDTSYRTLPSAETSVFDPVVANARWVCDGQVGEEMKAGRTHSLSQDPVEALNYGYVHTVGAQAVSPAPVDLPFSDTYIDPNPTENSVLRDWWSDYGQFENNEADRASRLSPGLWPWTTSWYGDVPYQNDSNSTGSIASSFLQANNHLWDSRPEYEEDAAARPWQPRDCSFSPSSDSTQSLRCARGMTKAPASKTPTHLKSICPKPILPRPNEDDSHSAISNKHKPKKGEPQLHRRSTSADCRDAFLVQSKLAGMSYKQIKEKGQFIEAESTLRGRFRTLTKHKEHRVRKPEWQEGDVSLPPVWPISVLRRSLTSVQIHLLGKAVQAVLSSAKSGRVSHHQGSRAGHFVGSSKIPWKQVAEYIWENGGSYHFGNATCRKKWDETRCLRSQERLIGSRRTGR